MSQVVDTLITFGILFGVMLIAVLASAIYEKVKERK